MASRRCSATKRDGNPCGAWAVPGSNPPRCAAHDEAPLTIETVIDDLASKQLWLSHYIDTHRDELDAPLLARLLALHGQNASRLGRLLRDRRALSGDTAESIAGAIALALDELNSELGTKL